MMVTCSRVAVLSMMIFSLLSALAGPRTPQQMRRAASRLLTASGMVRGADDSCIRQLEARHGMSIMGCDSAFAVIASDDAFPEVLAYSPTSFETAVTNPHFNWWMRMTEKALDHKDTTGERRMGHARAMGYANRMAPLITTHWGQRFPYNKYCPNSYPAGCVSIATSQVLKYNGWPRKGQGTVFTYVPFGDPEGTRYEELLGEAEYRYSDMADDYWDAYLKTEGEEVATLVYHVGLAVKSNYQRSGTGSYSESLCHGLRTNLGYPFAVSLMREDYTSEEWMDMIYASLSEGHPIIYGGSDEDYTGHEFVLDGYDEDGKIHINWGWDGSGDGFFDLEPLMVFYYDFSYFQDMVARCSTDCLTADTVVADLTIAGTLAEQPGVDERVRCLKVRGPINGTDLRLLRALSGSDVNGHGTRGQLSVLDLSEATIVAGGDHYLSDGGMLLTTSDNEIPYKAFSKCSMLIDVRLPEGLTSYGGAVFANCYNLDRVELHPGTGSDFVLDNGLVLSSDRTRLIECLPDDSQATEYIIPDGVREVGAYAFSGRYLYERLMIPGSVERIGAFAFNRCFDLTRTYVFGELPPAIDPTAIDPLDISLRKLYVPSGCMFRYATASGWQMYLGLITEFDATGIRGLQSTTGSVTTASNGVYDLQGRSVKGGLSGGPGIYVSGSKKIIVR